MTLEEYEKILEEKRKALQALKTDSRKVDVKEFESMQQLSNKKAADDIFIKLVTDLHFLENEVVLLSSDLRFEIWVKFNVANCVRLFANLIFNDLHVQGSEKDKKKELAEKEERAKKVCFIH